MKKYFCILFLSTSIAHAEPALLLSCLAKLSDVSLDFQESRRRPRQDYRFDFRFEKSRGKPSVEVFSNHTKVAEGFIVYELPMGAGVPQFYMQPRNENNSLLKYILAYSPATGFGISQGASKPPLAASFRSMLPLRFELGATEVFCS